MYFVNQLSSANYAHISVPSEQVSRVDLVGDVGEVVGPAVGDDHVAAAFEALEVHGHLGAEEVVARERGLVDKHGNTLCLDALHDALDGARPEVVRTALHGESVDADQGLRDAFVHELAHVFEHLIGNEVLAGGVGVYDCLDEVLGDVTVVGEELPSVLRQAVASVAEARVVIEIANPGVERHAPDDVRRGEALGGAVGVELVEVRDPQRQVGVREELHRLGLRAAKDEGRDADRPVGVLPIALRGVRPLLEQRCEALGGRDGLRVVLRRAHHDAARMKIVVEGVALAQELRAEDDAPVAPLPADALRVPHRDGGLHDDPGVRVHAPHRVHRRLHGGCVEGVGLRVVVRGASYHHVLGAGVGLRRVGRGPEAEAHLLLVTQEPLDLGVPDGALAPVEHLHLFGHHVDDRDLVALAEQQGDGQANVARPGDGDLHFESPSSRFSRNGGFPRIEAGTRGLND